MSADGGLPWKGSPEPFSMKMVKMDGMKKSREWITGIM